MRSPPSSADTAIHNVCIRSNPSITSRTRPSATAERCRVASIRRREWHKSWPTAEAGSFWQAAAARVGALGCAAVVSLQPLPAWAVQEVLYGQPRIVDGDTLEVRLYALDAPETSQSCKDAKGQEYACGEVATEALRKRIGASPVSCEVRSRDRYGRRVSACFLPGMGDIGDWLVRSGNAVAYREYGKEYVNVEAEAREARRGIWAGSFQVPAEFRRDKEEERVLARRAKREKEQSRAQTAPASMLSAAEAPSPPDCRIKGNTKRRGAKEYHWPFGHHLDGKKIQAMRGECSSEQEAGG